MDLFYNLYYFLIKRSSRLIRFSNNDSLPLSAFFSFERIKFNITNDCHNASIVFVHIRS